MDTKISGGKFEKKQDRRLEVFFSPKYSKSPREEE